MSMTDSIADLLTRIRNANQANHEKVDVPFSRLKQEIVRLIKDEGFIKNYRFIEDRRQGTIRIFMKYGPSRVYASVDRIPRVLGGLGVAILSTSQGIMTDRQARRAGIGGEVLCYIW